MSIPKTHPLTVVIHEPMVEPTKQLARDVAGGSVSELLMLLLYKELLLKNRISKDTLRKLGWVD